MKPSWRLMEAIFFNTRKALGFDQWQLRDHQTESNPFYFCDFDFLLLHLLPFLIPRRSPLEAHHVPWGGTWPELWDWAAKSPTRGEGSEFWAHEFTPWEEGKALVKGMESLWRAYYNLQLSIDSCHTHLWLHLTEQHHLKTLKLSGFLVHKGWI